MKNLQTRIIAIGESPKNEALKVTFESMIEKLGSANPIEVGILYGSTSSISIVLKRGKSLFSWDLKMLERFGFSVRSIGARGGQLRLDVTMDCLS